MYANKLAALSILLPLLAQAAPQQLPTAQGTGTSTTDASKPAAVPPHYAVAVPTQGITLTPADHAAIEELVTSLSAHVNGTAAGVDRRFALPAIGGVVKYLPSVILPTIFNMAYDMVKDIVGEIKGDDGDEQAAAPGNGTVSERDALFARELNVQLEARGLGSLATGLGSSLGRINLKPVLQWLPALLPALIGPAFEIAKDIAAHIHHGGDASSSSSSAPVATATPAVASVSSAAPVAATSTPASLTLTSAAPSLTASVSGSTSSTDAAATETGAPAQRRADAGVDSMDYPGLMKDIQSMIVADPGLLHVPGSPDEVKGKMSTMISPGLATAVTAVEAQATA